MRVLRTNTRNPWIWIGLGGALVSFLTLTVAGRSRLAEQPVLKSTGHRLHEVTKEATSTMDEIRHGVTRFVTTIVSLAVWSAALGGAILVVYAPRSSQRRELWEHFSTWYDHARELATEAQHKIDELQHKAAA